MNTQYKYKAIQFPPLGGARRAVKWQGGVLALCLLLICLFAQAQTPLVTPWHNINRTLRYTPDGQDFVIKNGTRRFNRALYGTNTAFRVEAGDLPEFALYLPGMGGNLKFGLIKGDKSKWLIKANAIEARYRPGTMIYHIRDTLLGTATLTIQVEAGADAESIIVKVNTDKPISDVKLLWAFGGVTGKKFSRDGDIGADPESSFYLQPDYCKGNSYTFTDRSFNLNFSGKAASENSRYEIDHTGTNKEVETITKSMLYGMIPASSQLHIADANAQNSPVDLLKSKGESLPVITGLTELTGNKSLYWVVQNAQPLKDADPAKLFTQAEAKRTTLAGRVKINTPDPYINTLGGALAVAADGIWESPSYMHGAVAWRMRLPAWRGPYVADPLGWHDRAWSHFSSYAQSQITDPNIGPVVADTALHLARQQEKLGMAMFSNGYISRNPGGKIVAHHYDMNLVYIDELLNHFKWTGNLDEVKQLWPTIKRSLAWEKRNFDADGDGLYDAYAAIWASDAMQYSGGGVTHTSAYNYRANRDAADIAKLLGDDPKLYQQEADKILNAINKNLWIPSTGSYAEYKDLLGEKLVHPAAGLWTIYHAIDSHVPDAFQTYQALRYVDTQIPHIPVIADGLKGNYYLLSTTNWEPYDWSLNNVVMAENLHTALAYWQGNRAEDAFTLWKSALLESMYLGASPGNFQQISFYDNNRGELYRDFGDPIGMAARSLVEGLFGIQPDLLNNKLVIKLGLPAAWDHASLEVPDLQFDFKRKGMVDEYTIVPSFKKQADLDFKIPARLEQVIAVTVNGKSAKWTSSANTVGQPMMQINVEKQAGYKITIVWAGKPLKMEHPIEIGTISKLKNIVRQTDLSQIVDPQQIIKGKNYNPLSDVEKEDRTLNNALAGYHSFFIRQKQGVFEWLFPVNVRVLKKFDLVTQKSQQENSLQFQVSHGSDDAGSAVVKVGQYQQKIKWNASNSSDIINVPDMYLVSGSNQVKVWYDGDTVELDTTLINWHITPIQKLKTETIDLKPYFNDKVTNIFKNQYLSPRPKSPTLQLPTQGIGNWAYPLVTADIDDNGLKKAVVNGVFTIPQGIPFATPTADEKNILFTSQWDNFPKQSTVSLSGKASHAYFLMAGSTNPMQSRMVNGIVTITYTDGTQDALQLKNPENWWPIEQDCDNDGFAFNTGAPRPLRVALKTGEVSDDFKKHTGIKGFSTKGIDGGAATVLDLPLNVHKELKSLILRTITNDVVIGLMAVTLIRE